MSLFARLALTLAGAMVAVLLLGAALGYVKAGEEVRAELEAARGVAVNAVTRLIAALPASRNPEADIASLVSTFNGDRHVRILMIDAFGQVRAQSALAEPDRSVPGFFVALLSPAQTTTILPMTVRSAPIVAAMVVVMPANEVAEIWGGLALDLALLLVFAVLTAVLGLLVVRRALRPLGGLSSAFHRIGQGDTRIRLAVEGPPEVARLARGVNAMAERLDGLARDRQRLAEQLSRLADEERAELARDLHDDVGPFLFAVDVDAASIRRLAEAGADPSEIVDRTEAIRQAAGHARLQVRKILGQLRPGILPGLGLVETLEHLVDAARARHPAIAFTLSVEDCDPGAAVEALVVRAVREAVNNALRHGHPRHVAIRVADGGDAISFRVSDDGGGFSRPEGERGGYGLIGMRERVEGLGGRFSVTETGIPAGVSIFGEVPLAAAEARREAAE
ncbi:hypothetical protein ASG43_10450 [Aureimonas sp. Leaf454]|uniref:sensor histidine kinase n=1 Tax=Aureimonas sp. Leaf454 TaxID=1736381 RepID=UPI0006FACCED|nr:HAMP domain-containing protein [Aureimonas sp. Leaf454]KQT47506.1 hypothetical protein ASG43_10450 [Aureimonas sp. Leaf454]